MNFWRATDGAGWGWRTARRWIAWNGTSLARWKLNNPARAEQLARGGRARNNRRLPFRVIHLGSFPRDDDERHVREDPLL